MKKLVFLLIVLIFLTACSYIKEIRKDITGEVIRETIPLDEGYIEIYFCPRKNCEDILINLVENSEKIHCAFFELNLINLSKKLEEKKALIVIDDENYNKSKYPYLFKDNRSALMHNKFCIFDDEIISTGSFNPTNNKNNNNLVIIKSKTLAQNYEDEFQSFVQNEFGYDEKVKNPKVILNNEILIENYFCPEDNCEQHVYDVINKSKKTIYFMTFSFTSDKLGNLIIEKSKDVEVKGIFENFQSNTKYSEYPKMIEAGMNVIKDKNPSFMHHKVFIIDDIIILGSYNPTSSGTKQNDENVLIIYDKILTSEFLEEFDYIWNL